MRISELSSKSGVPVPTIKYYLREGLLDPGTKTGPNQADYGEEHLHRLRLVRALIEVGGLPIATVGEVVTAIEDQTRSMHEVLGVAQGALGPSTKERSDRSAARAQVDDFLDELGWSITDHSPARNELASALATLWSLGWEVDAHVFERYARLADDLASWEFEQTPMDREREEVVESVVVGTVVFETALVALRRLAHESHSADLFSTPARRN
jgi:DNA-binding transcriptional MerR regulator